jgi:RimJ/RimL family protein N-acetyltransferase
MERHVFISDGTLALAEYRGMEDNADFYECWQDEDTQRAFNYQFNRAFDEFSKSPVKSRFIATVIRLSDNARIGVVFVSPEGTLPDLAIMLYKPYRTKGYGTKAFLLATEYCFEHLGLDEVYAGCYPQNAASLKMLKRCGYVPHPQGNQAEKHYLTGEPITQLDFVASNSRACGSGSRNRVASLPR